MFVIAKVAQNADNIKVLALFFERGYVYNTKKHHIQWGVVLSLYIECKT